MLEFRLRFESTRPKSPTTMENRIRRLLEEIEANPGSDWTIRSMAQAIGLSHSQVSRLFLVYVGSTPATYVRVVRLRRAEMLLSESHLSVKEIAYLVGFRGASHFSKEFKSKTGLSPSEYRRIPRTALANKID